MFREFGTVDETYASLSERSKDFGGNIECIRNDVIGNFQRFSGPFGYRPCVYTDWTASGRILGQVENFLLNEVMPLYGNTHTTTTVSGLQSTCFRHEARQIIAQGVNAKIVGLAAEDIVLFVGNGTTAAVSKLIDALGLNFTWPEMSVNSVQRPVIFVSSYEHHSNLIPWRESVAEVVTIAYHSSTGVCLDDLRMKLRVYSDRKVKLGSFSAASNITGVLTDVDAVAVEMHLAGGWAFFDYATAAPYVKIDMNPIHCSYRSVPAASEGGGSGDASLAYKDAVFFSGHKFLGGPGSPGVLVVKRKLLPAPTEVPSSQLGGGTVFYVTEDHHRFLSNREEREEGGTPQLLADVKLGIVVHLQQTIGASVIEEMELNISVWAEAELRKNPRVVLVGRVAAGEGGSMIGADELRPKPKPRHLPIFSFLIRCGPRFLHHSFVSVLLNDLFGVQARGGCLCAGPFAQDILGISRTHVAEIEAALLEKHELYRPGVVRFSLPFWMTRAEMEYVIHAVHFVADNGYMFLPLYRYNHRTGEWAHTTRLTKFPERRWISSFRLRPNESATIEDEQRGAAAFQINEYSKDRSVHGSVACNVESTLKVWGVSSVEELLNQIRREVDGLLERVRVEWGKVSKQRTRSGKQPEPSTDGSGRLESLRWFTTVEDLMTASTDGQGTYGDMDPIGPIQPQRWSARSPSSRSDVPVAARVDVGAHSAGWSAYGGYRDLSKFRSRTGGEERVPRYMNLMRTRGLDIPQPSSSIKHDNAAAVTKPYPGDHDGGTPPSVSLGRESDAIVQKNSGSHTCATVADVGQDVTLSTEVDATVGHVDELDLGDRTVSVFKPNLERHSLMKVPPKRIMKSVGHAVKDWDMIKEGDRLLLGLSGGKDSLALLHILIALQKRAPVDFDIACATVDPQTASFDPSPLIPYVQSLGIPYHFLSEPIVELAKSKLQGDSLCAFCSRMKRGLLYKCCLAHGYNKLVLAQHLDDLAESFLMSAMHNGQVRTMKANYPIEAGDNIRVIRPLVYVREKELRDFSVGQGLPIINENCPACFEQPKERHRVKELLSQEERMIPGLFGNLRRALKPLMDDAVYAVLEATGGRADHQVGAVVRSRRRPRCDLLDGAASITVTVDSACSADSAQHEDGVVSVDAECTNEWQDVKKLKRDPDCFQEVDISTVVESGRLEHESVPLCGVSRGAGAPLCFELA